MNFFNKKESEINNHIGYLTILIHLSGQGFDPRKLEQIIDYPCTILQNIGEITKRGRNKGKIATGGFCCYEFDDTIPYDGKIKKAVGIYVQIRKINTEQKLNIDWFRFSILFSGCQGNIELSKDEIEELSKLDNGIAMTYIGASEIDYRKQKRLLRIKNKLYYED